MVSLKKNCLVGLAESKLSFAISRVKIEFMFSRVKIELRISRVKIEFMFCQTFDRMILVRSGVSNSNCSVGLMRTSK